MTKARTLLGRVSDGLNQRFGSASARYRLALSGGFVIASIGMATVVVGQSGQAEDFFSAFGSLFSMPQAVPQQAAETGRVVRQTRRARRASYADDNVPRSHPRRRSAASRVLAPTDTGEDGRPIRLGRASICVRLCDGFAFPVGAFHGEGDIPAHEATCRSECPSAQTSLYVLPNGTSSIGEAVEARTGHAYSEKASGFHYTTYLDESCSCHPRSGNRIASLLHDFTLRRGDAVVTSRGLKVFHGGGHYPYRQADFMTLAQSRDIKKASLREFRAIERASVSDHPTIAASGPPTPAAGLKPFEHQAALDSTVR